ncbi:phosphate acetyltransferase [Helicobacter suis]|uniref:phosphate acetyltransferase n=1 Tax=Helicobacter suis TaxID=104628 RepID=UPI0019679465|nr:phosphate acetyltransferase [Helicobacter suis]
MGQGILICARLDLEEKGVSFLEVFLKQHHKSVALFTPMNGCDQEVLERLSNNDEGVFSQILEAYTPLVRQHDYVLVLGSCFNFLVHLDSQIYISLARHLNLAIVHVFSDATASEIKLSNTSWKRAGLTNPLALIQKSLDTPITEPCVVDLNNPQEQLILKSLETIHTTCLSPLAFQHQILKRAKENLKTIVLPESGDVRILKAAHAILQMQAAKLILLGEKKRVDEQAQKLNLDLKETPIIDPNNSEYLEEFAQTLFALRRAKGLSLEQAKDLVKTPTYFGTLLVHMGYADGMVSGATHTTADTVRPALQIIKLAPGNSLVSSVFFMCLHTKVYIFGDCAINPNPNSEELAQIAITSAKTAKNFGFEPKVALLSYSSGTSGKGADVDKVAQALQIAKKNNPDLAIDGPLQFDASVVPAVGARKMPGSLVAGQANVLIFPDLDAGNIAYKAVQRCAQTLAIGPVLQGLKKPVNDLSRGCLVEDVINTIIMTAIQAQGN